MPCNPSIGGSAKGIVVRRCPQWRNGEENIDKTYHPNENAQYW